jgi:hypothetical protein
MTGWLITGAVLVIVCIGLVLYGLQKLVALLSRP